MIVVVQPDQYIYILNKSSHTFGNMSHHQSFKWAAKILNVALMPTPEHRSSYYKFSGYPGRHNTCSLYEKVSFNGYKLLFLLSSCSFLPL